MDANVKSALEERVREKAEREAEGEQVARRSEITGFTHQFGMNKPEAEELYRRVAEGEDADVVVNDIFAKRTRTEVVTREVPDSEGDYAKPQA
jgi:hypothetical protein